MGNIMILRALSIEFGYYYIIDCENYCFLWWLLFEVFPYVDVLIVSIYF